jgi:hypothetical protein
VPKSKWITHDRLHSGNSSCVQGLPFE